MSRRYLLIVALLGLPVASGQAVAKPLSEEECRALTEQRTTLERQGLADVLAKGASAASGLATDRMNSVAEYLRLEGELRMRCNLTVDIAKDDQNKIEAGEGDDPFGQGATPRPSTGSKEGTQGGMAGGQSVAN